MTTSGWFATGAFLAGVGVLLGAFGAHSLENMVEEKAIETFRTGARYQMIHALALLAVAFASTRWPGPLVQASGWLFVLGIALFCGSLYAITFTGIRTLGAITPIGGLCFISGWICLGLAALRSSNAPGG